MARVLIIEDEKDVSQTIGRFLMRRNFLVDFASSFEEGMEKSDNFYEITLLDINLDGKNSFPILEKIKNKYPKSIVIMVTAHDGDENVQKARQMGADDFIPKPIVLDTLKEFILEKIEQIREDKLRKF